MRIKAALAMYLLIRVVNIIMGATYLSANQFTSYHSQAIGATWQEVGFGTQTIIFALMKVAGGGWLALGFLPIVLGLAAFVRGSIVVRWALPLGTLIFYAMSFAATWGVYQATGASTPWGQSLAIIGFALLALFIDSPWASRVRDINDD